MPRENLIYEDLFERATPEDKYTAQQQWVRDYSVQSSTTIVREGTRSVRFEHRRTDNISSGYRVEFQSDSLFQRPTEAWYGYSVYFENWSSMNGGGEHIMQWHPTTSGGSASLATYTTNGTFHVRLNPEGDSTAFTLKDGKKIESNRWYDVVTHVKWAAQGGIVEMWIDGEKYVDYGGPTLTRGSTPYFKMGINRWGSNGAPSNDRVLYFDALRIGNANATYADVAPGESTLPTTSTTSTTTKATTSTTSTTTKKPEPAKTVSSVVIKYSDGSSEEIVK
jgi:hypothetical protein